MREPKSKGRSKSQRIGTAGEDHFRLFAGRHRLIANKCEQDFGTDFLCQIEGGQGKTGVAPVLGGLLGVFVRSTENKRGRIRLDREDVEHLLACEYPIFVVLVHLRKAGGAATYFRFVDGEFGEMLAGYLEKGKKSISLTPSNLNEERMFDSELSRALMPGFVEQFRVRLAAKSLDRVIPHSRVQVRRSQDESITLVKVWDFFAQFANDPVTQKNLYKAVFGHGNLMTQRFGQVMIRPEIIDSLRRLPSPIVIGAHMTVGNEVISVAPGDNSIRSCTFEVRTSPGYIGWAHQSGFAITASERTLHENKLVHWLRAQVDSDVPIFLPTHEDLWAFLEGCKPGAKFRVGKNENAIDAEVVENLVQYGFFARYLRRVATMYPWPEGTWRLGDATNEETLDTLGFLFFLSTTPEKMNGFGFALSDLKGDELPIKAWVPICMNLPRNGLVVWILTEGRVLTHQGDDIGFKFGEILEREIEVSEKRFVKSPWPEIVVHKDIKTIPLVPPTEDVNQHSSDPSTWGCGIVFDFNKKDSSTT